MSSDWNSRNPYAMLCWWEKFYHLSYSKRSFMKLQLWMLCQWCRKFFDMSLRNKKINVSFFNCLLTRNLNDTSINTKTIYGNLIIPNPLKKQIYRSITTGRIIILITQVPIINQMDVSNQMFNSRIQILEQDDDEEFTFLKQFFLLQYTLAKANFCWPLKLFFTVPNSLVNT